MSSNTENMMYFFASAACEISDDKGDKRSTEFVSKMFSAEEYPNREDIKQILKEKYEIITLDGYVLRNLGKLSENVILFYFAANQRTIRHLLNLLWGYFDMFVHIENDA